MPYRANKPVAADKEKDAQVFIQQNFSILNDLWNINHRDINEEDPGHKYISFPAGGAPATGASETALFARAGVYGATNPAELCFRRLSSGVINEFTSDQKSAEGWTQLPSGILIKWIFGKVIGAGAAGVQTHTWNNAANYPAFTQVYQAFIRVSSPTGSGATDIDGIAYINPDNLTLTQVEWAIWKRSSDNAAPGIAGAYRAHIWVIGKGPGV